MSAGMPPPKRCWKYQATSSARVAEVDVDASSRKLLRGLGKESEIDRDKNSQPPTLEVVGVADNKLGCLGVALPTLRLGIRIVHERVTALVPWVWGVNGAASVFATVISTVVAINYGFTVALLVGVTFYATALVVARVLPSRAG